MIPLLLKGFITGGSLIVAIGAQNVFVLKQGLQHNHRLLTALLCSTTDAILITFGVLGFGHIVTSFPVVLQMSQYFAIAFLIIYGFFSLRSAFSSKKLEGASIEFGQSSAKNTFVVVLALSILNPHVYLDTVVLLGSVAAQYTAYERIYFAIGAISASFAWFFLLTYGAGILRPYFQSELSWKIIDYVVCVIMWFIAMSLIYSG